MCVFVCSFFLSFSFYTAIVIEALYSILLRRFLSKYITIRYDLSSKLTLSERAKKPAPDECPETSAKKMGRKERKKKEKKNRKISSKLITVYSYYPSDGEFEKCFGKYFPSECIGDVRSLVSLDGTVLVQEEKRRTWCASISEHPRGRVHTTIRKLYTAKKRLETINDENAC